MDKRKRNTALSIKNKLQIIDSLHNGQSKKALAERFKCDLSTISRICKNETELRQLAITSGVTMKRQRKGVHDKVESALFVWFTQQSKNNAVLSSRVLLDKAKEFANALDDDFEPQPSWLFRWRKRHNIKLSRIIDEAGENDKEAATDYETVILPGLLRNYNPNDIFNADETALYYKATPNSTNSQKVRVTLLLVCNATGTYKKAFVIGHAKNPRCLQKVDYPLPYFANKNAWMTEELWNGILLSIDEELGRTHRNVILFVDNASCHKSNIRLNNIKLSILPPNTNAVLQPLKQGIIASFKREYRQIIVRKQLNAVERDKTTQQFLQEVSLLSALSFIKQAWDLVTCETIANCFKKVGFVQNVEPSTRSLQKEVNLPINVSNWNKYVQCDSDVPCYGVLGDDEIIELDSGSDGEDSHLESPKDIEKIPSTKEAFCALRTLELYATAHNLQETQNSINELEMKLLQFTFKNKKQLKITNCFTA